MDQKRPENIIGYETPLKFNYSKDRAYKTFTEGKKEKKNEKFSSTIVKNTYASNFISQDNLCPQCKNKAINFSNCVYNIKSCEQNHFWFTDRSGEIKQGKPSN
tara:strand:- start:1853 stop:2161 length:309 start_codon:yes stop_codon:yes gene_type:complete